MVEPVFIPLHCLFLTDFNLFPLDFGRNIIIPGREGGQ